MNKNLTFNVAEATRSWHSLRPASQLQPARTEVHLHRLTCTIRNRSKWLSARTHTMGNWTSMVSSTLKTIYVSRYPTELWKLQKSHYNNLETALIDIGKKPVYTPYTVADSGNPGTNHLCYKQFDYLYHFVDYTKKGQEKRAILEMPIPVAPVAASPWTWATSRFRRSS